MKNKKQEKEKEKERERERERIAIAHGYDFVPRRRSIFGEACPLKPRRHTD